MLKMKHHLSLAVVLAMTISTVCAHQNQARYAPGVPPAHQHQQQQQQQYQPPPQQQQQPPVQQQQQYQAQQQGGVQPPVQAGVGHGHGHDDTLRFSSDIHNAEHVMEHLENVIETKPKEQMTEEELEFHYFKMHDYDDNNKLDGVEIGKALTHYHAEEGQPKPPGMSEEELSRTIDSILAEDDLNGDGYVEYVEFVTAQRRASVSGDKEEPLQPPVPQEGVQQQQDQQQQQQQQQQQDQHQQQQQQQDQHQQQQQQQDQNQPQQQQDPLLQDQQAQHQLNQQQEFEQLQNQQQP